MRLWYVSLAGLLTVEKSSLWNGIKPWAQSVRSKVRDRCQNREQRVEKNVDLLATREAALSYKNPPRHKTLFELGFCQVTMGQLKDQAKHWDTSPLVRPYHSTLLRKHSRTGFRILNPQTRGKQKETRGRITVENIISRCCLSLTASRSKGGHRSPRFKTTDLCQCPNNKQIHNNYLCLLGHRALCPKICDTLSVKVQLCTFERVFFFQRKCLEEISNDLLLKSFSFFESYDFEHSIYKFLRVIKLLDNHG